MIPTHPDRLRRLRFGNANDQACKHACPPHGGWFCSRPKDHPGSHMAADMGGEIGHVAAIWDDAIAWVSIAGWPRAVKKEVVVHETIWEKVQ